MELGDRDKKILEKLYPPFQDITLYFLSRCWGVGINAHLSQGLRTVEEQDEYYRLGTSKSKGGYSFHNYGIAFDIIFNDKGESNKASSPYAEPVPNAWSRCADIGYRSKLWPGFFFISFKDKPHFQARIKTKIPDLLAIKEKGTLLDVWSYLDTMEKDAFTIPTTEATID